MIPLAEEVKILTGETILCLTGQHTLAHHMHYVVLFCAFLVHIDAGLKVSFLSPKCNYVCSSTDRTKS